MTETKIKHTVHHCDWLEGKKRYLIEGSASTPSCLGLGGAGRALGGRAILRLQHHTCTQYFQFSQHDTIHSCNVSCTHPTAHRYFANKTIEIKLLKHTSCSPPDPCEGPQHKWYSRNLESNSWRSYFSFFTGNESRAFWTCHWWPVNRKVIYLHLFPFYDKQSAVVNLPFSNRQCVWQGPNRASQLSDRHRGKQVSGDSRVGNLRRQIVLPYSGLAILTPATLLELFIFWTHTQTTHG